MNRFYSLNPQPIAKQALKAGLLGLALFGLAACQSAPSEKLTNTLTVAGRGDINIPTTLTQVQAGVEVQGETAEAVQQQVAERSQAVISLLKSRQVEKLETTGISLNPNYTYKDGKQEIKGYIGSNTVSFRIKTDKAGNILDEAVKAGATRIQGVSFIASDDAIAIAQQEAIREATADAQTQAKAALSALNLSQRDIVNVQINGMNAPYPMPMPAAFSGNVLQAEQVSTPVEGGRQKVVAGVTLQIRY